MSWFVYILRSDKDGDLYKGITEDIQRRLEEHNSGKSKFTSAKHLGNLYIKKKCPTNVKPLLKKNF